MTGSYQGLKLYTESTENICYNNIGNKISGGF
jgi:hypothetical protein